MSRVLVPLGPGNFAAFGSLISDIRRDYVKTRTMQLDDNSWPAIEAGFAELEAQARENLLAEGVPESDIVLVRSAGMRFLGQSWELNVDLPPSVQSVSTLTDAFADVHDRRFGHRSGGKAEIVTFRVGGIGRVSKPALHKLPAGNGKTDARVGQRDVYFDGTYRETPVYLRERLAFAQAVEGPAVIEESGSTTVLPPGWRATVLDHGELMLSKL
jgi:N-methylhydantoinase A